MGAGAEGDTIVLDVLVVELICAGLEVGRGIRVGGGGSRNLNASSAGGSDVATGCRSSVTSGGTGGDAGTMMDEVTMAGDTGGGFDSTGAWSVTCSGEHAGVGDGGDDTTACVGVLLATSDLRLPGGKDTVKTSLLSSPTGSRGGVKARGWEGCTGARTMAPEDVPGSLTRYEGTSPGRGR
jgi:hypothetical protein